MIYLIWLIKVVLLASASEKTMTMHQPPLFQMRKLEEYGLENEDKYPWMSSAWNRK